MMQQHSQNFNVPNVDEWTKPSRLGPPPPDRPNPLDRLAKPRPHPHPYPPALPHFMYPPVPQNDNMSLNFAPPPRKKIDSLNGNSSSPLPDPSDMKETSTPLLNRDQENVVVTDVTKQDGEEGECSEGEQVPPPPPPKKHSPASQSFPPIEGDHSEEGECDSDPEDGEVSDGDKDKRDQNEFNRLLTTGRSRNEGRRTNDSPRSNVIPLVKNQPGPPVAPLPLDSIQRKLEHIASSKANRTTVPSPVPLHNNNHNREPNYRDRDFRERVAERPPVTDLRENLRNNNGSYDDRNRNYNPRDDRTRNFEKINRSLDFRKDLKSVRPGDMPSLISLPPMPQISSSAKGKVPDFPPLTFGSFGAGVGNSMPHPPVPAPIPHPIIPPPAAGSMWPHMPPMPGAIIPPAMPSRHIPDSRPRDQDSESRKYHEEKIKDFYEIYNKAWEVFYHSDKRSSSHKSSSVDRTRGGDHSERSERTESERSRSLEKSSRSHPPQPHPGMPAPFPGMAPMIPGMPPHMMDSRHRSKEGAWERGLKLSKKIREEVRRNEKSDDDSDEDEPGLKLQSKIVMKENKIQSNSPSSSKHKSARRPSPISDDGHSSSNGHHAAHGLPHPRLTPERYRGAYERKPVPEERRKSKNTSRAGDEWRDPWMRSSSPKERKRQLSSSSSDTSTDDSLSPTFNHHHQRSIEELKRSIEKRRRRKKELRRLKERLPPSDYEMLTKKRSKRGSDHLPRNYSKQEMRNDVSDSDSDDSDGSSSSSTSFASSPGNLAGKLADSPTSPPSSPDMNKVKDKKKKKEALIRQLQRVEEQLKKKEKRKKERRH